MTKEMSMTSKIKPIGKAHWNLMSVKLAEAHERGAEENMIRLLSFLIPDQDEEE